jgi:hypothetical protein
MINGGGSIFVDVNVSQVEIFDSAVNGLHTSKETFSSISVTPNLFFLFFSKECKRKRVAKSAHAFILPDVIVFYWLSRSFLSRFSRRLISSK